MTLPARSVCLDVQGAQNQQHFDRGIPRYVLEHARGVVAAAPDAVHSVVMHPGRPLTGNLDWLLGQWRLGFNDVAPADPPALYHVMSPIELDGPLELRWPGWARRSGAKLVVTVYDLIPFIWPDRYLSDPRLKTEYLARLELLRGADHLLAISAATAFDLQRLLGVPEERITVVDAGVSAYFAEAYTTDEHAWDAVRAALPSVRPGFLFYVAGFEWRKNIEGLLKAYGQIDPAVRRRHQLVVTCRLDAWQRGYLDEHVRDAGLAPDEVLLTGYVSDAVIAALYRVCRLFVFASLYEGSGLPILEAMAAGAPVTAGHTSTGPEILGDREATFDPNDPTDMAAVISRTVTDDDLLAKLRERSARRVPGYTWTSTAEKTLGAYERALAVGSRRRRARPRLAVYTPWPPARSGIATYNRRLVAEIARHVDVDVIVDDRDREGADHGGPRVLSRRSAPAAAPDRVLYCMGNSFFNRHVFEAMRQSPGTVVAHDVRLVGFYGWYAGQMHPPDPTAWLSGQIDRMYGDRIGHGTFAGHSPSADEQARYGLYMTHDVQESAEHLIVHSAYAADILRLDTPVHWRSGGPPADVVPHAFPDVVERPPRRPDPAAPLIVSFGIVHPVKQPALLIEAAARLVVDRPGLRLVFAGGAGPDELAPLQRQVKELGLEDHVELPGHVDDDAWQELLATADLAVQLRAVSNGEASGAVAHCLSAGLPTVVTGRGWMAELPDGAVAKVPPEASAADLATAIADIVDVPDRAAAMGAAAQEHARAASYPAVAQRYLEILELA